MGEHMGVKCLLSKYLHVAHTSLMSKCSRGRLSCCATRMNRIPSHVCPSRRPWIPYCRTLWRRRIAKSVRTRAESYRLIFCFPRIDSAGGNSFCMQGTTTVPARRLSCGAINFPHARPTSHLPNSHDTISRFSPDRCYKWQSHPMT